MQTVGYAALQVIPSVKGFKTNIQSELNGGMAGAGVVAGRRYGGGMLSTTRTYMKRAGIIATGFFTAKAIHGGISRALDIDDATHKLEGLKYSTKQVEKTMAAARDGVLKTAFGLDEAATASVGALGAGIKNGQQLTKHIRLIGDATTQSNIGFAHMAEIVNKVEGEARLTGTTITQLQRNGLQIMPMLEKTLGKPQSEIRDMARAGAISSKVFKRALEENIGGSALKSGETVRGATRNMGAAFARLGAQVMTKATPKINATIRALTDGADAIGPHIERAIGVVGPHVSSMVDFIGNSLTTVYEVVAPAVTEAIESIGAAFRGSTGPSLDLSGVVEGFAILLRDTIEAGGQVVAFLVKYRDIVIPVAAGVGAMVVAYRTYAVVAGVAKAAQLALNVAMAANPLGLIVLAVVGVVTALTLFFTKTETGRKIMSAAWAGIKAAWSGIRTAISGTWAVVSPLITKGWNLIKQFAQFSPAGFIIKNWRGILNFFKTLPATIKGVFASAKNWLINAGKNILTGMLTGITKTWSTVLNWVKGIPGRITGALSAAGSWLSGTGRLVMTGLRQGITKGWEAVRNWVSGIPGRLTSALAGAASWLLGVGKDIVNGLISGIGSMKDAVVNALLDLIPGPLKKFAGKLGIASPSKVFARLARWIPKGIAVGIRGGRSDVDKAMAAVTDRIVKTAKKQNDKIANIQTSALIRLVKAQTKVTLSATRAKALAQLAEKHKGSLTQAKAIAGLVKEQTKVSLTETQAKSIAGIVDKFSAVLTKSQTKAISRLGKAQTKVTKMIWGKGAAKGTQRLLNSLTATGRFKKNARIQAATLADFARARERVAKQLEKAQTRLADAVALRDDFKTSVIDSVRDFTSLMHAEGAVNLYGFQQAVNAEDIITSMTNRLQVASQFSSNMSALLSSGLNKQTYQELIEQGPEAASAFAVALLEGGPAAIRQVNALNTQINTVASELGTDSSKALYQSGVDAAQGLVKGLQSQISQLDKAANRFGKRIAKAIRKAIKKALRSKSPSKLTEVEGRTVPQGLAVGIANPYELRKVADAGALSALTAVTGMEKQLAGVDGSALPAPVLPTVPAPAFGANREGSAYPSGGVHVHQTINNPQAEPTSKTVDAAARLLGTVGAL